ncbi:MAG: cytochrome c [Flavobacteriales bacterium]|jgi:mono/diheme cytochrome c family protein|nr:cytochrome c [Flavobacteriales bacterium]
MKIRQLIVGIGCLSLMACGGEKPAGDTNTAVAEPAAKEQPSRDIGVGPVSELILPETIDDAMAAAGKEKFETLCSACHKLDKRFIGPKMNGIMDRREPEWVMNMILNPDGMVKENEAARQLLMEYSAPMANQNLTEEEARNVVEYFRTL